MKTSQLGRLFAMCGAIGCSALIATTSFAQKDDDFSLPTASNDSSSQAAPLPSFTADQRVKFVALAMAEFNRINPSANAIDKLEFTEWITKASYTWPHLAGNADLTPNFTKSRLSHTYEGIISYAARSIFSTK